jgi:hypothetical protein
MSPQRPLVAVACAVVVGMVCLGCQNQPSHIANPLYSADRVPPPATRALAPGSAQPYYSGDPLPVMPAGSPAAGQSSVTPRSPDGPLDWSSPSTAKASAPAAETARQPTAFAANTSVPPVNAVPSVNTAGWWDAPLNPAAQSQPVLPLGWSEEQPTSAPPRVRMPQSQVTAPTVPPPIVPISEPAATDGFRSRGSRPAPY